VKITEKLKEIPDEAKSDAAKEFTAPAKELHEYDEHRKLVFELSSITNLEALQAWYTENRQRIDQVVSQNLRNELFDTIRELRSKLEQN
jgi:hypothetical protein